MKAEKYMCGSAAPVRCGRNSTARRGAAAALNVLFLLILLTACERHIAVPDDAPAAPEWLREKIAGMEHEKYYAGASVVRHEWKSKYYYYINIPPSSCMYCEVYDAVGNRVDWTQEDLWDYVAHRTNEVLIYKRGMR